MDADGSNVQRLTTLEDINYRPAWSPDSSQIAWRSSRSGSQEIWVMDADGSDAYQLTYEGGAYDPGWGR
jgi:TolB protein